MSSATPGPSSLLLASPDAGRAPSPSKRARAARLHVAPEEVNDVRKLLNLSRPDRRPQRPIPKAELEEIWRQAWIEATRLPRITL
jgi:hypothetical protein